LLDPYYSPLLIIGKGALVSSCLLNKLRTTLLEKQRNGGQPVTGMLDIATNLIIMEGRRSVDES
jgi:hypothetical protein